jgi:uncharacterized protein YrrD
MKRNINSLIGFKVEGTDGDIGSVVEFYFDDATWTVRYLIVDTGRFLFDREVLISSGVLLRPDWEAKLFRVNLTREQIKTSPDIDTKLPVARQEEIRLQNHYLWAGYWGEGFYAGGLPVSMYNVLARDEDDKVQKEESLDNPHLRNTRQVKGYTIKAVDGDIGDICDFIVDDSTWRLDFLVVDTGHWFPGKKVLISPDWVKEIHWKNATINIKATIDQVKNSPEYHADQSLSKEYQLHLHNYFKEFVTNVE